MDCSWKERLAAIEKSVRLWESLYVKDSMTVFLVVARVSQLSSRSFSVLGVVVSCAKSRCLNSELSAAYEYPSRSRDPMRHYCIRGLVELRPCTLFLLPISHRYIGFTAQRQVLKKMIHQTDFLRLSA